MAHEISEVMIGGRNIVEAMYANIPAWHGLGEIFDPTGKSAPDSATAMRKAHLGWRVEKEPFRLLHDGAQAVEGWWATVRQDTKDVLGVVKGVYEVQQNEECFSFLDNLLQDGILRYESAMALQGGKKIALLARMPGVDTVTPGDHSLRYVLFTTSHDGSGAITVKPTWVRVVCANTLRMALDGKCEYSIRHTASKGERLEKAARWISQFDKTFTLYRENAQELVKKKYTQKEADAFLDELFPAPELKATERIKRNHRDKIALVRSAIRKEERSISDTAGTWWGLVNGITQYVDHSLKYKGATKNENRFSNVLDGKGADLKDKAFALALAA